MYYKNEVKSCFSTGQTKLAMGWPSNFRYEKVGLTYALSIGLILNIY